MPIDKIVRRSELQNEIADQLGMRIEDLVFEFLPETSSRHTELKLITINPVHSQSFLFHSIFGSDPVSALELMLTFIKDSVQKYNNYTVQWSKASENELQTSYFRASSISHLLEKFSYGRHMKTLTIFSITLNPIS